MPTYEYECGRCKHVFERFQSMTDEPLKTCPKCRGRVKRMIGTGAGLLFKGSGFYITDYRNASYQQAQKAEQSVATANSDGKDVKKPAETTASPVKPEKSAKKPATKGV